MVPKFHEVEGISMKWKENNDFRTALNPPTPKGEAHAACSREFSQ